MTLKEVNVDLTKLDLEERTVQRQRSAFVAQATACDVELADIAVRRAKFIAEFTEATVNEPVEAK